MKAWHFTKDKLRDCRPLPKVGEKLVHEGDLILCRSGLHGSKSILDALKYAPGCLCHRVECGGRIIQGDDKFVCSERTILWTVDTANILPKFARLCALDVIDLWDAPDVVVEFLKTGNPELAEAAWLAARSAGKASWSAWDAAEAAWSAEAAARSAAWDAAWAAARAKSAANRSLRDKQERRLRRMVYEART